MKGREIVYESFETRIVEKATARLPRERFESKWCMKNGIPDGVMLSSVPVHRVYLACGSTDLRKSIDGLAALVQEGFQLNPFEPALFVFCNR
jgi:hypothetical protein